MPGTQRSGNHTERRKYVNRVTLSEESSVALRRLVNHYPQYTEKALAARICNAAILAEARNLQDAWVRHKDGDPRNNDPDNLEVVTEE